MILFGAYFSMAETNTHIDVNIKIFSLNCNGLGDKTKRMTVLNNLKRKGPGIFMLQETHSTPELENSWIMQWGSKKVFFSHGTSNSRGTAILVSDACDITVNNVIKDVNGRYVILDADIDGMKCTIANIYAPTRNFESEQIEVFRSFTESIELCDNENIFMGGDYNVYLNPRLDKLDNMMETSDNSLYRDNINAYLEVNNLVDIWRILNPDKRYFTWRRGEKKSRLDYLFTSEHMLNFVDTVNILPGICSDHSLLCLVIKTSNHSNRGKGFWKFNSSLLNDDIYVKEIKKIIDAGKVRYEHALDKGLVWEIIKSEIRSFTVPYTSKKKKENTQLEQNLNKRYTELYSQIQSNLETEKHILEEFYTVKSEIEFIEKHKARGLMLRSKAQWIEEGETNSSYFLKLEKQNYCNKLITQIQVGDNIISDEADILCEQKSFYEKLYSDNSQNDPEYLECVDYFSDNANIPKIDDFEKTKCDENLTEQEILKSLKAMKNCKSPGSDGLTSEFYKFFWIDIKYLLLNSLQYALDHNELSIEQKRGIITLIPKKDKNRLFLKNWRPISLLNLDYKILAKLLANRMIEHLPGIINEDQTGYIQGRFIGCNIRLTEDIMSFTAHNNIPGILLLIDFEKAFDSLKWSFIDKALELANFGLKFRSYIKTLYNGISTTVINNGKISEWFSPQRGVRQGCPISPYLFILAVEILASNIRENPNIKGITINGKEIKLSQLADDMTCFLKDIESVKAILQLFEKFRICAGLKVNIDKTKAKCLGSLQITNDSCGLDWTTSSIHLLGVTLTGNEDDHYIMNFKKRLKCMQNLFISWKTRNLSLKGKITVINNLALPPLIYLANVIHVPERVTKEVKDIVNNFLWGSRIPKISHNVTIQKIEDGGLKLIDFTEKVKSLKVAWIKRLSDKSNANWKILPSTIYMTHDLVFYFSCTQAPLQELSSKFYLDIHNSWSEINKIQIPNNEIVRNQVIWSNRYITIQNKPFKWNNWINNGIIKINDIVDEFGSFISHIDISEKFSINCNFLDILQLRQSLPYNWRKALLQTSKYHIYNEPCITMCNNTIPYAKCNTKQFYWQLVVGKKQTPTCVTKWQQIYPDIRIEHWEDIFCQAFKVCRETKLQSFQYKIIHRLTNCNKKLFDMNIKDSPKCTYCPATDDIRHFFLECPKVKQFWMQFFNWWNRVGDTIIPHCGEEVVLFGFPSANDIFVVLNYCMLQAKYFIYKRRLYYENDVDLYKYLISLKYILKLELYICKKNGTPEKFEKFVNLYDDL